MPKTRDFLVEIGTEELPPKALPRLIQAFRESTMAGLESSQLTCRSVEHYATPRRLALLARGVPETQPEQRTERRGPAISVAFDDKGNPTRAAEGFARSCNTAVEALEHLETPKGHWLVFRSVAPGQPAIQLLPGIVQSALDQLPIPKRMRWGSGKEQFVRPVHWVLALFGGQTLTSPIMGLRPRSDTFGHRFHHPGPIPLASPTDYSSRLATHGHVIAEFDRRREIIRAQVVAAAEDANGQALIDASLLEEVTGLVEWPVALLGSFDETFLDVPQEALVSTLQDHQKCFPVVDTSGRLLPRFIAVSNIESRHPDAVRAGNERVVRPRFADAKFFWEQDRKQTLASRIPYLDAVVFQRELGSLGGRVKRITELAMHLADRFAADVVLAKRAAELAKCDLLTHMVNEFPELQGVMGRYYAAHDGEDPQVATAIAEHYLPRFAGDRLPESALGQALALADRLDTVLAIFAIGKQPTGASDPYALRRNALGVIRTAIDCRLPVELRTDLAFAAATFQDSAPTQAVIDDVLSFFRDRLKGFCLERGYSADEIEAAAAPGYTSLLDFHKRLDAVSGFRRDPAAASLEAANKRIRNILRQAVSDSTATHSVDQALLQESAEVDLDRALDRARSDIQSLGQKDQYSETLAILARLREPVDAFFDQVLVMDPDDPVRRNRLALCANSIPCSRA